MSKFTESEKYNIELLLRSGMTRSQIAKTIHKRKQDVLVYVREYKKEPVPRFSGKKGVKSKITLDKLIKQKEKTKGIESKTDLMNRKLSEWNHKFSQFYVVYNVDDAYSDTDNVYRHYTDADEYALAKKGKMNTIKSIDNLRDLQDLSSNKKDYKHYIYFDKDGNKTTYKNVLKTLTEEKRY